jgi:hypothetical protein
VGIDRYNSKYALPAPLAKTAEGYALPPGAGAAADTTSAAIEQLALAIYRNPAAHQFWFDASTLLPEGVEALLRAALRGAPASALGERFPSPLDEDNSADELLMATLFFILNVMLAGGADHYRTLGLPANADKRDIAERYQVLRRLLTAREKWPAVRDGIERISNAYVVLRDPKTRRSYDAALLRGNV